MKNLYLYCWKAVCDESRMHGLELGKSQKHQKRQTYLWLFFDERLELCHRALMIRHERLLGTPSDVAPILWQYGAIARLEKGQVIDELLKNNYSTISLGLTTAQSK